MQNKFNFTKKILENLPTLLKRTRYKDEKVNGLIIEVMTSGRKSFRVYKKIKGNKSPLNVTLGVFPNLTIEQARKLAYERLNQISEKINPNHQDKLEKDIIISLEQVYKDFILLRKLKPKTLKDYKQIMDCYFDKWKKLQMTQIMEAMVLKKHQDLTLESGKAQADYCMRVLRALFNFAKVKYKTVEENPIFTKNPTEILSALRQWNNVPRKNTRILQKQIKPWFAKVIEIQNDPFLSENIDNSVAIILQMAILTGLRKNEILHLKWNDINFDDKSYSITDTKNGMLFELPISNYLFTLLKNKKKNSPKNSKFVFYADNKYGYVREPKKIVKKIINETGIEFGFNDLKRTFLSIAESLLLGTSYTLKRLINHKTGRNDVTGGYVVLTPDELREPSQRIEDKFMELAGLKKIHLTVKDQLIHLLDSLTLEQQQAQLKVWDKAA